MLSWLDPRLWLTAIGAAAIVFLSGYFKGHHDGEQVQQQITASAVAEANHEARKNEQLRQDRVDEAARAAAARERGILASAASARRERDGLRDDLDAIQRASADSIASANAAVRLTSGLLGTCTDRYLAVAEEAARADSEARELRAAWPK